MHKFYKMNRHLALFLFLLISCTVMAQEDLDKYGMKDKDVPQGLNVGDEAPSINLTDNSGKEYSLEEALEDGPVVLTFYRGNWCPYCNRYLSNLVDSLPMLEEQGASLIAISPESAAQLAKTSEKVNDGIKLLSDEDGVVMRDYDVDFWVTEKYQGKIKRGLLRNIAKSNEQEEAILPVPATYIIGKDGKIVFRYFDINYRKRVPVSAILKALKEI